MIDRDGPDRGLGVEAIDEAQRNVANGTARTRYHVAHLARARKNGRAAIERRAVHHDGTEGLTRAGRLISVDNLNPQVLATDFFPVGDLAVVDVGGLLGGLPTSALGQNVGIICSNKVVNKWVFVIIAAVFAIAGLFPQLSAVLSAIPQPVIGGATVGVFGTITMNGVRMFTREGLTQRTTTIVGTSVVFGLGIWMASGCLAGEGMPAWVSTVIGSNAVTPTAIMAIVLNLILPQTPVVAQHIDAAKDAAVDLVLPESKK